MTTPRIYAATGPRSLDDRVLQALHASASPAGSVDDVLAILRGTRKAGDATLADVEAALGRLIEAGRVKVLP